MLLNVSGRITGIAITSTVSMSHCLHLRKLRSSPLRIRLRYLSDVLMKIRAKNPFMVPSNEREIVRYIKEKL